MSRKSLTKKETAIWFNCSSCGTNILAKDRELHTCIGSDVEPNYTIIRDKILFSNQMTEKVITDDIRDINENKLKNILFVHESIFALCDLVLGDNVSIESIALSNNAPIVRMIWPIMGSIAAGNLLSVCDQELNTTWKAWTEDSKLIMKKLDSNLSPAMKIILKSLDPIVDEKMWMDIKNIFTHQMQRIIYHRGNQISFDFFNKQFNFTIKEIVGVKVNDEYHDLLLEKFEAMQIKPNDYYLVTNATKFELELRTTDTPNEGDQIPKIDRIGGMGDIMTQLQDSLNIALYNENMNKNRFTARSVLLIGQHGSGKTLLCDGITEQYDDALVIKINATDIFSKYFGESESKLQNYFEKAYQNYPKASIIVIEEISSICPKEPKEESAKRVQMTFLNILDEIHVKMEAKRLFLITTTSNLDDVSVAVRRYGRLDVEIEIPVPDPSERELILLKQLVDMNHNLSGDDIKNISNNSHGFIASDLSSLVAKASMHAVQDRSNDNQIIRLKDMQFAYGQIVPSAMKEVMIKCPNVKWSDIGGQDKLKLQLKQAIEWPLTRPEVFTRLGITPPRGILMFGPPGCSKTMIAKALATESNVNFLSIKGPELFSMWVGESERAVRDLFHKARQVAPAIIFFDEIDAIGSERSPSVSGSSVKERVLTQLLTEMDGVNSLTSVTIVAATNRPDIIDRALLRPGRLDRLVYISLPDPQTRHEIFRIKLSKMPISDDVTIDSLVKQTDGYSGAEIQAICQEAAFYALEDDINVQQIFNEYFLKAIMNIKPRTSPELLKLYHDFHSASSKTC